MIALNAQVPQVLQGSRKRADDLDDVLVTIKPCVVDDIDTSAATLAHHTVGLE